MRTDSKCLRRMICIFIADGDVLRAVLPYTAQQFRRALIMPNTTSPILNERDVMNYRDQIALAAYGSGHPEFEPLMSIQITEHTTPETIRWALVAGASRGKNASAGVDGLCESEVADLLQPFKKQWQKRFPESPPPPNFASGETGPKSFFQSIRSGSAPYGIVFETHRRHRADYCRFPSRLLEGP